MEFSLFAHMERLRAEQPHEELYAQFLDLCRLADDGGMRAIWTGEHHGMDAWEAGQRMREIAPLLRRLWEGDCAHEGEYYRFPTTTFAPKPVQPGGPPICIAAHSGEADHPFRWQVDH